VSKASSIADGGQAFALYLDAGLVAVVALLAVIVLGDSIKQWYGYVVLKRPFTSSEVVVMAGGGSPARLQTTIRHDDEERRLQLPGGGCC
jgi:carbon starvation protein